MQNKYTLEEDKQLNADLYMMQVRAKELILNDCYDSINLSDLEFSILKQITNAQTHYDISPYLWNTGMLEKILNNIEDKINKLKI